MTASSRASVATGGGRSDVRSFPITPCGTDDGWLEVESSAVCGTDVTWAAHRVTEPTILGHHVVGTLREVGPAAAHRWGLAVGDRVAVEEYLPCGSCADCVAGRYRSCPRTDLWGEGRRVGMVPVTEVPALWGGNAEHMYLAPNAVLHRLPPDLDSGLAAWTQPLGNALDWTLDAGELRGGETIAIVGPGYHGLAAVAAARHVGAERVIVIGQPTDHERLGFASRMGAHTIADPREITEQVADLTHGRGVDAVLDVAGSDPTTVTDAVSLLAPNGRLVVAGIKNPAGATVDTEELVRRRAAVRGVRGRAPARIRQAIEVLATGGAGLAHVPTANISLDQTGPTLARMAAGTGPRTPHVVVRPTIPPQNQTRNDEE